MTSELDILGLYGLLLAATIGLQTVGMIQQLSLGYMLSARDESRTVTGITARLKRATENSVVAMVLFAPAVLILHAKGAGGPGTLAAAQIFLLSRLVYLPAYAWRITGVRTLAWAVGFVATLAIYLAGAVHE